MITSPPMITAVMASAMTVAYSSCTGRVYSRRSRRQAPGWNSIDSGSRPASLLGRFGQRVAHWSSPRFALAPAMCIPSSSRVVALGSVTATMRPS